MTSRTLGFGLITLLAFALLLIWFPSSDETKVKPPDTDKTVEQEVYRLRFGHNIPTNSAMHQAALRFAEEVARKTGGRVQISVHPEQELGNDHEMVEMARAGELDILLTPTAKMSVPVPAMQYADLPFLFPSREDAYELLDGEPGQMLLDRLRPIGLVGVTFWENGFKHFTGNRPLLKPEDFSGLNIRVMKSRILMEQFKSFGAHPVPIDFHATRKALADGVVDGQENPLIAIVSMGFHEVQSDMTLSGHGYLTYVFSFSEKVFSKLPIDIQEILYDTARELAPWERAETQKREEKLLEAIHDAGVRIHELDEQARRSFAARTTYIADQYEEVIGADIMSKTQELLYKKYANNAPNKAPIVIGLDADLSMDAKVSGLAIKRGALLAVNDINARGGLLGRPLRLIARDHKGLPSHGVENMKHFAADPNVIAVMAGQHGPVVNAELETVHDLGMPFLLPWSAVSKLVEHEYKPNFVFRVSANDRLAAPFIIDYVIRDYKKPAILYENSVWGRGNYQYMDKRLKENGLAFAYKEEINRGSNVDFRITLAKLPESDADVVVIVLKPNEGKAFIKSMLDGAQPLPLVSHWGITGGDLIKTCKASLDLLDFFIFQTFSFIDNEREEASKLADTYTNYFGFDSKREIDAPSAVAQSYDLVKLLALAIEKAGTTERLKVRNALEQLPAHEGVIKNYHEAFSPDRHDALEQSDYIMTRLTSDCVMQPIE